MGFTGGGCVGKDIDGGFVTGDPGTWRVLYIMSVRETEPDSAEVLEGVTDLVEIAGTLKSSTVVIAGGHRVEDLRLVESARDHGIVRRAVRPGRRPGAVTR